jgi:ATP-dependent Clp protease adaptor protein ClpS
MKLLNDTPMEFVVEVLRRVFDQDREDATRCMPRVHHDGVGPCGRYPSDVLEPKVAQVLEFARAHEHSLRCVTEPT